MAVFLRNVLSYQFSARRKRRFSLLPVPGCGDEDPSAPRMGVPRRPGVRVAAVDWERDPAGRCPRGSRDLSPRRSSPPVCRDVSWNRRRPRHRLYRPPHQLLGHLPLMRRVRCCRPPFLGSPTASAKLTIDLLLCSRNINQNLLFQINNLNYVT